MRYLGRLRRFGSRALIAAAILAGVFLTQLSFGSASPHFVAAQSLRGAAALSGAAAIVPTADEVMQALAGVSFAGATTDQTTPTGASAAALQAVKKCLPVSMTGQTICFLILHVNVTLPGGTLLTVNSGGSATFATAPTAFAIGCPPPTVGTWGPNTFNATVATGGCPPASTIVFVETVTVTGTGQICQKVSVPGTVYSAGACAQLTYPTPALNALKTCQRIFGTTLATCHFTVALGGASTLPSGTTITVNMAGLAQYGSVTATTTCAGGVTLGPVGPTSFTATIGTGGCAGGSTITFTENLINCVPVGSPVHQTATTSFGGSAVGNSHV